MWPTDIASNSDERRFYHAVMLSKKEGRKKNGQQHLHAFNEAQLLIWYCRGVKMCVNIVDEEGAK